MSETSKAKFDACLVIAKVRGYKKLSEKQTQDLTELCLVEELNAPQCVDAVLNAPAERTARGIKTVRQQLGRLFTGLAELSKPAE